MQPRTIPPCWRTNVRFGCLRGLPDADIASPASVPRFPVPDLGDTVAKALRTCEPLANDKDEYATLERKAREFVQGEGTKLQALLQERAENTRNW
jgi:hypothetical protein